MWALTPSLSVWELQSRRLLRLCVLILSIPLTAGAAAQTPLKKNVLIISEVCPSHSVTTLITRQTVVALSGVSVGPDVVGAISPFDRVAESLTKSGLGSFAGNKFRSATKALLMVREAANAPVFGMSDTYMGHGIVGGNIMGEPNLWECTKSSWVGALIVILSLSLVVAYLHGSRAKLKVAEEKQRQLSAMLINAQEKERGRIASELHDDFSQRLALLALGLENAAEAIAESPRQASQQLHELWNTASEIGADLHTLSHRLHSLTLENLGLVPGLGTLCKEFKAQQGVLVEFTHEDIPRSIHPDVALCLFRIVQEGLRNIKKHSGASRAQVHLEIVNDNVHVSVTDNGVGFASANLNGNAGLGIRSMEERARLMGGRFELLSEPDNGTRIDTWVPLQSRSEGQQDFTSDSAGHMAYAKRAAT
jgi:signal transduction histidine kinase